MLVLTRKVGQRTGVGSMLVTVLAIRGQEVKLGFDGPEKVVREEAKIKKRKPVTGFAVTDDELNEVKDQS